jgi:penicillin-binding protein 1A
MVKDRTRVVVGNPADGGFLYWLLKFYLFGACILSMVLLASLPALYLAVAARTPTAQDLRTYPDRAPMASRIYSANGRLLTSLVKERRQYVPLDAIPALLPKAFIAAEDKGFYSHGGIDLRGITRAALTNLRTGRVKQGGSTITQQVAKTQLSSERSMERKLRELVLARRLEARFTKDQILEFYLNYTYMGSRAYGVSAAAHEYFDKELNELTIDEMALLAGLVQAPSRYSPRRSPERARRRRNYVLKRMRALGLIDRLEYTRAVVRPIRLSRRRRHDPFLWQAPYFASLVRRELVARYGKEKVYSAGWRVETTVDLPLQKDARRQALRQARALDKRQGWRGPVTHVRSAAQREEVIGRLRKLHDGADLKPERPYLALITSVDRNGARAKLGSREVVIPLSMMRWAAPYSRTDSQNKRTISDATIALRPGDLVWVGSPRRGKRGPGWGTGGDPAPLMRLEQRPRVQAALYAYDHQNGYAMAALGGLDYDTSSFNRTVQACRQPGSSYKPIFYSLALDGERFSMGSVLQDRPYVPEPGEVWNPQNVHGTFDGEVSLHYSLIKSLNLPAIQLIKAVGPKATARWARRLGFTTEIVADKGLALGASCVRMDELTRAFATFVRGGTQRDPVYVRQILDRNGNVVEDHTSLYDPYVTEDDRIDRLWATSRAQEFRVISETTAFLITKLLRDTVKYGIAGRCRIVPVPTGGKSGTSSDTLDTWFVGFTSQWAVTSWIGDDTNQRPLGKKEASYTTAIPMWAEFMRRATRGRPHGKIPRKTPRGLKRAHMDLLSGTAPRAGHPSVEIFYKPGTWHPRAPKPEPEPPAPPG